MSIIRAVMVPHPPIILPAVGHGEEKKISATTAAYKQAAAFLHEAKPETIVILTPHSVLYRDYFHISPGESAWGSFAQFGAPEVKLSVRYDVPFVRALEKNAEAEKLPAGTLGERDRALDHAGGIGHQLLRVLINLVPVGLQGVLFSVIQRVIPFLNIVADGFYVRVGHVLRGERHETTGGSDSLQTASG